MDEEWENRHGACDRFDCQAQYPEGVLNYSPGDGKNKCEIKVSFCDNT